MFVTENAAYACPKAFSGAALTSALRQSSWQQSLTWLQEAQNGGVQLNVVHLGAAMSSIAKATEWEVAMALLGNLGSFSVRTNILVLNTVMASFDKAGLWEAASSCLAELPAISLQADCVTLNCLISCYGRAEAWQKALAIFNSFDELMVERDRISFNAAMCACGSCWPLAVHLLREMPQRGIQADVISFNTALGALEASGHWQLSLAVLEERSKTWPADPIAVGVVVTCCETSRAVAAAVRVASARCSEALATPDFQHTSVLLEEVRWQNEEKSLSDEALAAPDFQHTSVLLEEVVEAYVAAQLPRGATIVDCTLGGAGHSKALLQAMPQVRVLGIDRDITALRAAEQRLAMFKDRIHLVQGNFADFPKLLREFSTEERPTCYGLLADLGVSSPQLDSFNRGFSFRGDGPLDMRMDTTDETIRTAAWHISNLQPKQLEKYIREFGEEEPAFAKLVAESLCAAKPQRTREAVTIIEECAIRACIPVGKVHIATKTFQALRILVNGELGALETLLDGAEECLAPGGLMAIITFHSLEDDLVRRKVRGESLARSSQRMDGSGDNSCWIPAGSREGLRPSEEEVARNARSRSARLRLAVRRGKDSGKTEENGPHCTFLLDLLVVVK